MIKQNSEVVGKTIGVGFAPRLFAARTRGIGGLRVRAENMARTLQGVTNSFLSHLLWILVILQLTACSGGGDIAKGGIDGTGLGTGPISGFGSIFVNDIEYDTGNAEILINSEAGSAEQLKLGMYVNVIGPQDSESGQGTAQRVEYRDTLRGPVGFVTPSTLRVLGHTVLITPDTRLYGFADLNELQPGDTVRISGPATGPAPLPATLVERVPAGEAQITGTLVNLDEAGHSFFIAGMRIFYGEAQVPPAQLYNGLPVEVVGSLANTVLYARHILALTPETLPAGSNVVINGTVTRFDSPEDFAVQYRPMRLPQGVATDIADRLGRGVQVEVRGMTDTQGVVEITKIIIKESHSALTGTPNDQIFRVSGPVSGMDTQMLEVFGVGGRFDERSRFHDQSGQNPDYRFTDARIGDYFSVAGHPNEQGMFVATMLDYGPFVPPALRQLQGPVTNPDALNRSLHIFNVPVFTTAQTRYYDASAVALKLPPPGPPLQPPAGTETDAAGFFARLNGEFLVYAFGEAVEAGMVAEVLVVLPFSVIQ